MMAPRVKKIPMRTCIGCGKIKNKKELLRIVRTPEGAVIVDLTGKKSGRGTYICPDADCLEKAFKGNKLGRKLEVEITPEDKTRIREELLKAIEDEQGG